MTEPDPPSAVAPDDLQYLKLLSIFHYVVAALSALIACIPLIHFTLGGVFAAAGLAKGEIGLAGFGLFFMVLAGLFIMVGWLFAGCVFYAGRCLAQQKKYMYCLVMGCIACMFMPFGTVLGVFTIIVLLRPSVKQLFQAVQETGR